MHGERKSLKLAANLQLWIIRQYGQVILSSAQSQSYVTAVTSAAAAAAAADLAAAHSSQRSLDDDDAPNGNFMSK